MWVTLVFICAYHTNLILFGSKVELYCSREEKESPASPALEAMSSSSGEQRKSESLDYHYYNSGESGRSLRRVARPELPVRVIAFHAGQQTDKPKVLMSAEGAEERNPRVRAILNSHIGKDRKASVRFPPVQFGHGSLRAVPVLARLRFWLAPAPIGSKSVQVSVWFQFPVHS